MATVAHKANPEQATFRSGWPRVQGGTGERLHVSQSLPATRSGEGDASESLDRSQHRVRSFSFRINDDARHSESNIGFGCKPDESQASRIISSCHLSNVAGTPSRVRDSDSGEFGGLGTLHVMGQNWLRLAGSFL